MATKCPKCKAENPETQSFCGDCGTQLTSGDKSQPSFTRTLETPVSEFTRGTLFADRYEIIEELGTGGMGKVYRVHDKKIEEEIAIKFLRPDIAADKKTIERFKNEIRIARRIGHRNVCRMYDLNEEDGTSYITMEYVRGEDLKSFIRRSRRLDAGTAMEIAKQVCKGLAEAQRLGVVHRDLKSNNIMIDKEGNARIMDFGIARSLKAKGLTGEGIIIGTPEYMSPEQAEAKEVDHRSDIYSLGVILYEMATGLLPFEGDTPLSIAMKHKGETPKDPKKLNVQIPDDLSSVILRCMEKNKEKRYQNSEELFAELISIEKGITSTERVVPKRKPITSKEITMKFSLKKLLIPVFVVFILVVISVIIMKILPKEEAVPSPTDKPSIAVLPFDDLSPQKDQEYFCDGMAVELIDRLTNIENLKVSARTSAFSFKGKGLDIREIGERLKVENVLEGSIRKAGNKLRITVALVNVVDGYPLWSEKYERDEKDIFALQDNIALTIVDKLKLKLLGEERAKLVKRHTENLEAYNLYVKGRYFQAKGTEEEMEKSLDYFQQAIEKDPTYALAYVGKADCYILLADYGFFSSNEAYPKTRAAAEKALEMDNTLAGAYASLGWVKFKYDWDWAGAERDFKLAIDLDPNYAYAHINYALYLSEMGRHDEAIKEAERGLESGLLSLDINNALGWVLYLARRYDRAIEQFHNLLEIDQNYLIAHLNLAQAYAGKGMYDEAIVEAQKAIELSGRNTVTLATLGYIYVLAERKDEAKKVLDDLLELSNQEHVSSFYVALVYTCLGQKDQAFEWLEKAYKERDLYLPQLKVFPWFDSLRSDPRFIAMLKKMNLE